MLPNKKIKSESIFTESQRLDSIWLYIAFTLVCIVNYILYNHLGETDASAIYTSFSVFGLLCFIFIIIRLETRYSNDGVEYKLFPFQLKFKKILWSDTVDREIVKYKPISDFGGWGLRKNKSGTAITAKGNIGFSFVQISTTKKILLGTQKPEELKRFLDLIKKK